MNKYYTKHPPAPGSVPTDGLVRVKNYDKAVFIPHVGTVWGEAAYGQPLPVKVTDDYEMIPFELDSVKKINVIFDGKDEKEEKNEILKNICLNHKVDSKCDCEACVRFREGTNPDVLTINEKISAADFRKKLDFFYFSPKNMSGGKVLYLPNMEELTVACQNALLKYIEDYNDKAVIVGSTDNLYHILPTVRSRVHVRKISRILTFKEFEERCFKECIGESGLYYTLTGGDFTKVGKVGTIMNIWKDIISYLPNKENMTRVFQLLHQVKEKDKDEFTNKYSEFVEPLINLMQQLFYCMLMKNAGCDESVIVTGDCTWSNDELIENINICEKELYRYKNGTSYKGKELFLFLIQLYEK